jgi:hypothetical protein
MEVKRLEIPDIVMITSRRFGDERDFFSETYNLSRFATAGIDQPFVRDCQSLSRTKATLRGLHCQVAPNPHWATAAIRPGERPAQLRQTARGVWRALAILAFLNHAGRRSNLWRKMLDTAPF